MVIILKGADFSANNIGKADVDVAFEPETNILLGSFSIVPNTAKQKAINDFVYSLKKSGLWDKITSLYLPFLAENMTEVFVNAKSGLNEYSYAGNSYTQTLGLGISASDATIAIPTPADIPVQDSCDNFHVAFYNTIVDTRKVNATVCGRVFGGSMLLVERLDPDGNLGAMINQNHEIYSDGNISQKKKLFGTSANPTNVILSDNGQSVPYNNANVASGSSNIRLFKYASSPTVPIADTIGIISLGKYLNIDDWSTYSSLCDALMALILE